MCAAAALLCFSVFYWPVAPRSSRFDISYAHVCMCNCCCLKQAVGRGARTPLVVGDMPFGSYEVSPKEALRTAIRFVKVRREREPR